MTIYSMTGYGRSEFLLPNGPVRVEIKSTNQKYLEVSTRMPQDLSHFGAEVRRLVQTRIRRGKVFLNVSDIEGHLAPFHVHVNEVAAKEHFQALKRLNKLLHLNDAILAVQVARMPDVITRSVSSRDIKETWDAVSKAIVKALKVFDKSRQREGGVLAKDMRGRMQKIQKFLRFIDKRAPKVIAEYKRKNALRFCKNERSDNSRQRANNELASFAKACDITEEIVRLQSHLSVFQSTIKTGGEVGRKIDFMCQEMMRETNTIGAKANDFEIADKVIQMKVELEKIREQAQNVE